MKIKLIIILGGVLIVLLALSVFVWVRHPYRHRLNWKNQAIPAIESKASDAQWVKDEIARIKSGGDGVIERGWLSEDMILMQNGEWLIYRSHCAKAPPHEVEDIFLAKSSKGEWYYTSYHFCLGMYGLLMEYTEDPPRDLASMAKIFSLREFDGKSNECLDVTRPEGGM